MARLTTAAACRRAARALTAIGLTALVVACGTKGPSVRVVAPEPDVADAAPSATASASGRFGSDEPQPRYGAASPYASIDREALEAGAPERYTVVRGDTLWDISDMFLKDPWRWPELWGYNPQIANPHLIYPGDELALEYANGRASILLTRNGEPMHPGAGPWLGATAPGGVTRLSPRIRSESLDDAVPTIPGDAIRQFLVHPRVVDLETIEDAPYVVGNVDKRLISASGNHIYARGDITREQTRYGVFRRSKALRDPISGRKLGYEITHVADAKLLNVGDPSTLVIVNNEKETVVGDILLPSSGHEGEFQYVTRLPKIEGEGRIISLVDAISHSGRNQIVVLNIGAESGIAAGDVLAIETRGGHLIDRRAGFGGERVELPNIRTGALMVFETFERVSYALVMESTRPVKLNDIVTGI